MNNSNKKEMSTIGFILSVIGAAVGLGNIWGFPTKMLQYGGPAFLIPFLIAVIIIGFPLLILEINMGHKWRRAPTLFYKNYLGKSGKSFAWFQSSIQLLIGTYYAIIITWVLLSFFSSFDLKWVVENNFIKETINSSNTGIININKPILSLEYLSFNPIIFIFFLIIIFLTGFVVSFGLKKGVEKVNKIIVPSLFLMFVILFIYTLTLKGAINGINRMFEPDFSKLKNGSAWSAGFSQAIFTFSLGVLIVIVFSSSSPINSDNTNKALIIVVADTFIALIACSIIACTLGAMSEVEYGSEVIIDFSNKNGFFNSETKEKIMGSSIIFEIFPKLFNIINKKISGFGSFVSLMFYISIFFAAFSSMISLIEPTVTNLEQSNKITRKKSVIISCLIIFFSGLIFTTKLKSFFKETTSDLYVDKLLIFSIIVWLSMLLFSKKNKNIKDLLEHNNKTSVYKLGNFFYFLIIISFIFLNFIFIWGLYDFVLNIQQDKLNQITWWQWTFSAVSFFVPLLFFVFGLGYGEYWKKLFSKNKRKIKK